MKCTELRYRRHPMFAQKLATNKYWKWKKKQTEEWTKKSKIVEHNQSSVLFSFFLLFLLFLSRCADDKNYFRWIKAKQTIETELKRKETKNIRDTRSQRLSRFLSLTPYRLPLPLSMRHRRLWPVTLPVISGPHKTWLTKKVFPQYK